MATVYQLTSPAIFVPNFGTKNNRFSQQVWCIPRLKHVSRSSNFPVRLCTDIPDASRSQKSQPLPVTSAHLLNHSPLTPEVDLEVLQQADAVREESLQCSALVARMGRGAVYLGSSRIGEEHSFFQRAQDLSKKVCLQLSPFVPGRWSNRHPSFTLSPSTFL